MMTIIGPIVLAGLLNGGANRTFERAMGELLDRLDVASEFRIVDRQCTMDECALTTTCRDGTSTKLHLHQTAPRTTDVVIEDSPCSPEVWKQLELLTVHARSTPPPSWIDATTGIGWQAAVFGGYASSEDSTFWFTNGP